MKKKIAVFANGWSNEYLELVVEGIRKHARQKNIDLFLFVNFSAGPEEKKDNIGEKSIFLLPELKEFDGAILIANTFNLESERNYLAEECLKYKLPAVCLEYKLPGIPYLGTDTYNGVHSLVEHVINEHGAKEILFVAGPKENTESQNRMQATRSAMQEAGLEWKDDWVIHADWSYYLAYERTIEWISKHQTHPDAIICANDEMAIGVCTALDALKIEAPNRVMVTGCDNIIRGQELYPILTTVARQWDLLGYEGLELLLKQMNGEAVPMDTIFDAVAMIGESCGCTVDEARVARRLNAIMSVYRKQRESNMNEWHLRYLDEMLAKIRTTGELKETLKGNFEYNHTFEGSDLLICLTEDYFADIDTRVIVSGKYTKYMETYVNLVRGKSLPNKRFKTTQLLPDYVEDAEESHIYMFSPLHIDDTCIGYVVQVDHMSRLYDQTLYTWLRHFSQDMERVRQNIRLEELNSRLREVSITDGLTGLKNRTGCEILVRPYLKYCQKEGLTSAIVFADVNRMKMINDVYGHVQGDLALRAVAEAIKKTLPKDWIAVRYGGDEFIMVGACENLEEAEIIGERLAKNLEEVKTGKKLIFPLTASIGTVVMHPEENYSMEECLREADEAMYAIKQKYHENDTKY